MADATGVKADDIRKGDVLRGLAHKYHLPSSERDGVIVEKLFGKLVERFLTRPTFVYDYPADISPFAKTKDGDPETADRMELFIGGMEVANMYSELTDPDEQERRAIAYNKATDAPIDYDYIEALQYGMPPCGGAGIGIDRLVMLVAGCSNIRETLAFSTMRRKDEAR